MIGYVPEHQVAAIRREIHHNEKGKILGSMKSIQNVFGYEDHLLRNDYEMINIQLVQFSCSVVSNSLRSHELQHSRPPCPSLVPGVYSNSCPLSR